jgi:sugar-specific transcriptional regulator TrmB
MCSLLLLIRNNNLDIFGTDGYTLLMVLRNLAGREVFMKGAAAAVRVISELGFTPLEAEIYVYLLQNSPATGYRIAKGIGRSFSITYMSLDSLAEKGAIVVDDGKSRLSRAVPIDELLDQMEHRFREQRERAIAAVRDLPHSVADDRIYRLTSVEQVYERCRAMLGDSRRRVLMEFFPEPLETLQEAIEEAAARGVDITARVYKPTTIEGVRIVISPWGDENLRVMRAQWLAIFADGREFILGNVLSGGKGVQQVVWSASSLLSLALYDYVNSDLHHYSFRPLLEAADSLEELRGQYNRLEEAFPRWAGLDWAALLAPNREEGQNDRRPGKEEINDASD